MVSITLDYILKGPCSVHFVFKIFSNIIMCINVTGYAICVWNPQHNSSDDIHPFFHSHDIIVLGEFIRIFHRFFRVTSLVLGEFMTTSPNGNIFRVTGPLCGNSPVTGEFPSERPVTRSFDVFFDLRLINYWVNNREAGDLRRYRAHYDAIVMLYACNPWRVYIKRIANMVIPQRFCIKP